MTATLFLTCFLACTFAFVVVGVFSYQVVGFLIKRAIAKHLPEILSEALRQGSDAPMAIDDSTKAILDELMRNAAVTPPGVTPHLSAVRCRCGHEQSVPHELSLAPFLEGLGWRHADRFDGWGCPACAKTTRGSLV